MAVSYVLSRLLQEPFRDVPIATLVVEIQRMAFIRVPLSVVSATFLSIQRNH